jgi:uncharacterized protein (TIGR01777 family)
MRILVTGGTGFIGKALVKALEGQGYEILLLSRRDIALPDKSLLSDKLSGVDAVVNMAGESIAGSRWTDTYKQKIRDSRILLTRSLADACLKLAASGQETPKVFISFSAVGYYGTHPAADFTEQGAAGSSWLAKVARDWEVEAARVQEAGIRLVILRLGVVLGPGGFLERIALPFRFFLGGPAGSGRQWISWIHRDDVVAVIQKALVETKMLGAYNLTAPRPATMEEMSAAIGSALGRPSWLRTPALPLRLLFGEMADELILQGQRALPERLIEMKYSFLQPELRAAVTKSLLEKE